MADNTKIEWCDSTWNPWIGCTKVSPGCDNCYAAAQDKFRHWTPQGWGAGQPRKRTSEANWRAPLKWNVHGFVACSHCSWRGEPLQCLRFDEPGQEGMWCPSCKASTVRPARRRVFCASLADIWDNEVAIDWLADFLMLCIATPNLDKLVLTKRIGNVVKRLHEVLEWAHKENRPTLDALIYTVTAWVRGQPPKDIWLGATIVNQEEADRDIPKLLATPARVRFLSMEPLLGPVRLEALYIGTSTPLHAAGLLRKDDHIDALHKRWRAMGHGIDWIIAGSESGHGARRDPAMLDWVRSLRDQCTAAGIPFLWKQDADRGKKIPLPELDGKQWAEFPT